MDCTRYEPLLSDLIDETLDGSARAEVEAHVESCPRCRALMRDLERVGRVSGTLERKTPHERVWHGIRAELESIAGTRRPLLVPAVPARFDRRWLAIAAL